MPHREATFRLIVGGTILALWAASMIVDMLVETYEPPPGLGTLMWLVATGVFGAPVVKELKRRVNDANGGSTSE